MSKSQGPKTKPTDSTKYEERRRNWQMQMSQYRATLSPGARNSCVGKPGWWWRGTMSQMAQQSRDTPPETFSVESNRPTPCLKMTDSENSTRRQSFLYRMEVPNEQPHRKIERHVSVKESNESHYITPFAQILSILKHAHTILAQYLDQKERKTSNQLGTNDSNQVHKPERDNFAAISSEELEHVVHEFDWCLEVLESLQSKQSVSSLAREKFCNILSRELSTSCSLNEALSVTEEEEDVEQAKQVSPLSAPPHQKARGSKFRPYLSKHATIHSPNTNSQVSDYIYQTFVEDDGVLELEYNLHMEDSPLKEQIQSEQMNGDVMSTTQTKSTLGGSELNAVATDGQRLHNLWKKDANFEVESVVKFLDSNKHILTPDLFALDQLSDHHPLSTLGLQLLQEMGMLARFTIPVEQMYHFLLRAEQLYHSDAPFHNSIHATDVLHTMTKLFSFNDLQSMFSDLEVFATLFACIIHDIDHPALTNQYLVNTNHELAILYNDNSVLENHHLHVGFNLLHSDPEVDITKHLTAMQRQLFRKIVISLVLSTDMSKHMTLLADLKTLLESQRASGASELKLDTLGVRIQILECLLHASDLGNPTKPLHIYRQWVDRITEELFQQGDREREAGLEISPMCDRHTACIHSSQVTFIDYIVYPLWETVGELLNPDAKQLLDNIQANREWFARLRTRGDEEQKNIRED